MSTFRSFNPAALQIYLHPYRITGFKGDTPITLAPVTADDEHEIGPDGATVSLNASVDERHILTLSLDPLSKGYKHLAEIRAEQRDEMKEGGQITRRSFSLKDPSNGDFVRSEYAVIISRPELSMGSGRDAVEVRILLPSPQVSLGNDL